MYEAKDFQRLMDIKIKSQEDNSKAISLATRMANLITDAEKCKRRFEASCYVFGTTHPVTTTFHNRYTSLSGGTVARVSTASTPSPAPTMTVTTVNVEWGSSKPQPEAREDDTYVEKGKGKGTLEIWKTWSLSIVHIYRNGETNAIGASCNFFDKEGKFLFGAKMVDWCGNEHSQEAESKYGKPESTWKI